MINKLTVSKFSIPAALLILASHGFLSQSSLVISGDQEPIQYEASPSRDPVARLQQRIDRGESKLEYATPGGYLLSVLNQLHVQASSQMLVFSKTSFQFNLISPANPRAIYFSDNVYVGWVRGGEVVEVSAIDPDRGAMFYSLDQRQSDKPRFVRREECLQCHASPRTLGVPGHMVRSVYTDSQGLPLLQAGSFLTDDSSPFHERWGGWYVTGTHGALRHMGNTWVQDVSRPDRLDLEAGANVTRLQGRVDLSGYARPSSDLVALMVLEHQTKVHNLITRANWETRIALHQQEDMNRALGRPVDQWLESTERRIKNQAEELLKYMLFTGEFRLEARVAGASGFQDDFSRTGPRDRRGRSLRDFDLQTRLFRYPCSFLIYSEAFEALPESTRRYFYQRLYEVLTEKDQSQEFSTLSREDRVAILEILVDTKSTLPDYWKTKPTGRIQEH